MKIDKATAGTIKFLSECGVDVPEDVTIKELKRYTEHMKKVVRINLEDSSLFIKGGDVNHE